MDAGPGHSCKHEIQVAKLVHSKGSGMYALQRNVIPFHFTIS